MGHHTKGVIMARRRKNKSTEPVAGENVQLDPTPPEFSVKGMWTDGIGRLGMRSLQILLIGVLVAVVITGMLQLTVVVIPTLIAVILTCALWPLVRLIRKALSPMLTAWTVFLGSIVVLGGIGTALVFSVINEWDDLVDQAVSGFNQVRTYVEDFREDTSFTIDQEQIDGVIDSAVGFVTSSEFSSGAISTIGNAASFFTGLILFLVILFFLLKDGDKIWQFFLSWAPQHQHNRWVTSGDRALKTFGGYIRGTAIVAAVDSIGIMIALFILQVPLALPLGVVVFFGSFIPMVGATVAGILATLVALVANGPIVALIVLGAVILVNQLEGNFLQPVVMSQTLNLHALVILMALTGGTVIGGLVGAILSVPLIAATWSVVKVWTGRDPEVQKELAESAHEEPEPDAEEVESSGEGSSTVR